MKKGLTTIAILGIICLLNGVSHAGYWFGITKTPVIEGKVVDANTGKPVENAVIATRWLATAISFGDHIGTTYKQDVVASNKEGYYEIPAFNKLRKGSVFRYIEIRVLHPLYGNYITKWPDIGQPDSNGIVHWDIKLTSNVNLDPQYFLGARKARVELSYLQSIMNVYGSQVGQAQKDEIRMIFAVNEKEIQKRIRYHHGEFRIRVDK